MFWRCSTNRDEESERKMFSRNHWQVHVIRMSVPCAMETMDSKTIVGSAPRKPFALAFTTLYSRHERPPASTEPRFYPHSADAL